MYNINVDVKVSIPIIGDESIMLIAPPNGFTYKKVLFDKYEYKEKMVDGSSNVSVDFYFALHGGKGAEYIIVLEHQENRVIESETPANTVGFAFGDSFDGITENMKKEYANKIFKYFSMLHLFKEGEVAIKYIFLNFSTQEGIVKNNRHCISTNADMVTVLRYPMIISEDEVENINHFIFGHENAYELLKNVVINDLEYTYHILDDATNFKNLITSLEVMFLQDEYGAINEPLSKRIAVFLEGDDMEMDRLYKKVKKNYIDRNNAVHKGIIAPLTRNRLDELRNLIRDITKRYIEIVEAKISLNASVSFIDIKQGLISGLKQIVTNKNAAEIWTDI